MFNLGSWSTYPAVFCLYDDCQWFAEECTSGPGMSPYKNLDKVHRLSTDSTDYLLGTLRTNRGRPALRGYRALIPKRPFSPKTKILYTTNDQKTAHRCRHQPADFASKMLASKPILEHGSRRLPDTATHFKCQPVLFKAIWYYELRNFPQGPRIRIRRYDGAKNRVFRIVAMPVVNAGSSVQITNS